MLNRSKVSRLWVSLAILTAQIMTGSALHGQTVEGYVDQLLVSENFDSSGSNWSTIADADNLFIIQEGEYILQRKATNAPYAIVSGYADAQSPFRLMLALKIDKSFTEQSFAGLMFMIQGQGKGGFLLEINGTKRYRIRQIVSGAYRYITGSQDDGGWIKNNALNAEGAYNVMEVRGEGGNFDIYFNGKFATTCTDRSYYSGSTGIIVGPSTRAKADYFYIFGPNEPYADENGSGEGQGDDDIIKLTESIILQKTEINSLKEENEGLRKTIAAMRSGDAEQQVTVKNYEKQVKQLESELAKQKFSADSLLKENRELQKFKEIAGGNANGDLVITLSKALKAEKEKTEALEKQLKELKQNSDKSATPKSQNSKQTTTPKKSSGSSTYELPQGQ